MEKRTLLALSLSLLLVGLYPVILQKFYPQALAPRSAPRLPDGQAPPAEKEAALAPIPAAEISSGPSQALPDELDAVYENERVKLVFNSKSGSIREVSFLKFPDSETKKPIRFLSLGTDTASPLFVRLLGPSPSPPSAGHEIRFSPQGPITVRGLLSTSLQLTKEIAFTGRDYSANLRLHFENLSGEPLTFRYQFYAGSGIKPRHSIDSQYIEANFYSSSADGKSNLRHVREGRVGKSVASGGAVDWVVVKDRHFSVLLKPGRRLFSGLVEGLGQSDFGASLVSPPVTLPARGSVTEDFLVYVGPNDLKELLPLGLEPLVNFGKLDWIGKLLVGGLELLQKVFKNYGIAIIALTFLTNILLFPLTRVSYMSMKRMQLVQPQMQKLREQHKKSPEKLNREMMELYKKHKVNPFGGCLPMLLQMPVFIALYVALSKSVAFVNARFLWVRDLSSPDVVNLPFPLPVVGHGIHVLPLVMTAAMALQQRLTQVPLEGQDPATQAQQKMMAVMMPVLFLFIFYAMPSGLVLYWLTNTVLMTLYQLRLKKVTLA